MRGSHPHVGPVFPFYLAQSKTPTPTCPEICLQGDQAEDSCHSMGPDTGGDGSSLANWGSRQPASQCQEVAGYVSPVHLLLLPVLIVSFL